MVFKITGQYERKSIQIKKLYYPIKEWQEAGLKKKSYVDTHKLYRLPKKWLFRRSPKLTDIDRVELFEFIENRKSKN